MNVASGHEDVRNDVEMLAATIACRLLLAIAGDAETTSMISGLSKVKRARLRMNVVRCL